MYFEMNGSQMTLHVAIDGNVAGTKGSRTFGWWIVKPRFLRHLLVAKWVLFFLCWAGALQGMVVNGFVNVVITTIERRFDLRSTETGLTAGAYDIASFLCLVPVSYFGGGNKPRWLGWGIVLMGAGSFLFAMPHFTAGIYALDDEGDSVCHINQTATNYDCQSSDSSGKISNYKYVFIFAQLLHGAGSTPLYTLGVSFIDENVQTKMSSVYVGVFYAMAIVGPAIGYLIGGQLLKIYTDIGRIDISTLALNSTSNAWVGAWWIGFLFAGGLSLIVAIPILGFPKELPGSQEIKAQKVSEAHQGPSDSLIVNRVGFGTSVKDMPKSLKILLANPTFMFLNMACAFEGLLLSGFAAFLPKFIESQFNVGASWAALLVGSVTVTSGGGGTFFGGYLIKRFNLRCAKIIKLCIGFTLVSLAACFVFFLNCPAIPFAGINAPYFNQSHDSLSLLSLNSSCSHHCYCTMDNYDPVCGVDHMTYYSPCYAGCTQRIDLHNNKMTFTNCSCIRSHNSTIGLDEIMASRDPCQGQCNILPIFLSITFIFSLFTFLSSMPALSATLRCVAEQQRTFALGIQWMIIRLLGSIPAPIVFGAIMDAACTLWQNSCGHQGSCRAYDNFLMSRYVLIISLTGKFLSSLCFFLAWFLYIPPSNDLAVAVPPVNLATVSSSIKDGFDSVLGEGTSPPPSANGELSSPTNRTSAGHQQWTARALPTSIGL